MSQIYMEQQKRRQQTQPASLSSAVGQSLEHSAETLPPELLANVDAVQNVKPHTGRELHLDESMSARMQAQFGIRMDQVELWESSQAAEMDAKAFAKGNVVQFAPGQFRPDTLEGQHLIQHELAHVAQQARGGVQADVPGLNVNADEGLEHQADMGSISAGMGAPASFSGISADAAPVQGVFGGIKSWFQKAKRSYRAGKRMAQKDTEVKQLLQEQEGEQDEMVAAMKRGGYSDEEIQAQIMFQRVNRSDERADRFLSSLNEMMVSPEMEALETESELGNKYARLGRGALRESTRKRRFQREEHLRNNVLADHAYTQQAEQVADQMASDAVVKQAQYDPSGMSTVINAIKGRAYAGINQNSVGQDVGSGNRFVFMRGNDKGLKNYLAMLKKAGAGTNQSMLQPLAAGLESLPDTKYSESTGDERAAYNNQALEDFDTYLASAAQDEHMMDALRQSADFYSGLGEYDAEKNPGGMVGGREEALHRGLNDMLLRSFFPAVMTNPEVNANANKGKVLSRANAMMKLQTSALAQSLGGQGDYSEQELAMRSKLQKFYQDTGLMPAPPTQQAAAAVPEPEPEIAPEQLSFQQKRRLYGG